MSEKHSELVDASRDITLNPVRLLSGDLVPWAVAFPRRYDLILAPSPKN